MCLNALIVYDINIRLYNYFKIIILIHINPLTIYNLFTLSKYSILNAMLKYNTTIYYILYLIGIIPRT